MRKDVSFPEELSSKRETYLDGLRGSAALIVVVFHFLSAYTPTLIPDQTALPSPISDTPIALLYNGTFAVAVFFVLSGFVVSNAAAKRRDPVALNLLLRYIRLALPATGSVIFAWVLLTAIPDQTTRLKAIIPHQWLQWTYQGNIPTFFCAVSDGLVGIFRRGGSQFNNVLWTMKIELIGSFVIYAVYGLVPTRVRLVALPIISGVIPLLHQPLAYEGFVFGAFLRDMRAVASLPAFAPVLIFFLGAILGSESTGFYGRTGLPDNLPHALMLGAKDGIVYPLAAAMIVYGCVVSPSLQAAFSTKGVRFLGRISFSLYLVHVPLLYTIFAMAYLAHWPISPVELLALAIAFILTSVALAYAFTITIDEPVLRLNTRTRNRWGKAAA
jgi:peptidoglycan/LPS O-acetylase OafA/YrhL